MLALGQPDISEIGDPRSDAFISRFEAMLIADDVLEKPALERARRAQAVSQERFDFVLSRLGLLGDEQLARALAKLIGAPYASARDFPETPVLLEALSPAFLRASRIVPLHHDDARTTIAAADPFNADAVAAMSFLLKRPVEVKLAAGAAIDAALDRLYGQNPAATKSTPAHGGAPTAIDDDVRRLEDLASEAPVIRAVQDLIVRAIDVGASDIHIEPSEDGVRVRLRIDGALQTVDRLPAEMRLAAPSRVKIMAQLNIAERRLPQDGRMKATARGKDIDLRVSTMPTMHGESVVLRILDRSSVKLDFAELGFSGPARTAFERHLAEPNGLILVTGPTGSGKTTTLYTALSQLNEARRKLFTVEDPIEYELPGVNQIQVNSRIGLSFAAALRSMLRQDPDIILVGEIRDLETAEIAIRASLTGHLVLSTLHTNSAAATVTRLLNMGVEDYLLASSLKSVLAQRLVRRLCSCAVPDPDALNFVRRLAERQPAIGGRALDASNIRKPVGCRACRDSGFSGRTAIYELLSVTEAVRAALTGRGSEADLERAARRDGSSSLLQSGLDKVASGTTTIHEVLRAVKSDDDAL